MPQRDEIILLTFDWCLRNVLPVVSSNATQSAYGYHGLYTHTAAVIFRGIDYAVAIGENPKPVALACAFHDMARTDDGPDIMHGQNAVPMMEKILTRNIPVPQNCKQSIINAVKNHTIGTIAPDYVSACLWDADRTRLAWEMGFEPRFFNTTRAKAIASGSADEYLRFMKQNMSEYACKIITQLDKQY